MFPFPERMMNAMENPADRLKPLINCPACQKKYDPKRVLLLAEDSRKTALHLECASCGASSLVFISLGRMGAVSLGMLTDLDREEASRFYGREAVTPDDALAVHRFLMDFRGDVSECLPREGKEKRR